jgi:predicted O-linked N-acetylglucosamine transferase (SPINDLY family)
LLLSKFAHHGIEAKRLILEKSSDYDSYIKSYSKVHISLDPFPWNGVTTSFESIWMGVPVFCLEGNTAYSRCTYSINKNLKMEDWIAKDKSEYLLKLEKILSDKYKLHLTKKNLRKNAIKYNLFNSQKFVEDLANQLNKVWKEFIIELK